MNGPIMYCSEFNLIREPIWQIVADVCRDRGLNEKEIFQSSREMHLVAARVLIARKARKEGYTLKEIGRVLNRDHSTIIHYLNYYQPD